MKAARILRIKVLICIGPSVAPPILAKTARLEAEPSKAALYEREDSSQAK
jgi:hypothetical protein